MSEVDRTRVPVALAALLPGLRQALAGRLVAGGFALLVWVALLGVTVGAFGRFGRALAGGWDGWLAVATLLVALGSVWIWSWRSVAHPVVPAAGGTGQWTLAARAFSRNRTAAAGLAVVALLYLVALLAPLIAPHDPLVQDLGGQRLLAPAPAHLLGTDQLGRDVGPGQHADSRQ